LELINGHENPFASQDFVMPTTQKNALVVNQAGEFSDVAICLQESLLTRFAHKDYPKDFSFEELPSLSILIEELSHFNYFCEKSRLGQVISPLDLEIQAEVDKFSFALSCLNQTNRESEKDRVFDRIFEETQWGEWVSEVDLEIYQDAHQIAKNFCRSILRQCGSFDEGQKEFQKFFSLEPALKRKLNR
jgi:hypothetical protein